MLSLPAQAPVLHTDLGEHLSCAESACITLVLIIAMQATAGEGVLAWCQIQCTSLGCSQYTAAAC